MQQVKCDGWWEQNGLGRQPMDDLLLSIQDGSLIGQGTDVVGDFELRGELVEGRVSIMKQYVNAHEVYYSGTFDGEGTLQGNWAINSIGGSWLIRIVSATGPAPITSITP